MPGMVLGHAATAVIALQHRHVAVACVAMWAWAHGMWGGLEKTVCGHAMHTPGTHQAHAGQAHIMHVACTCHAHTGAVAFVQQYNTFHKMLHVCLTAMSYPSATCVFNTLTVDYGINYGAHVASMSFGNLGGTTT